MTAGAVQSTCYGTTKHGRLEHGVQLPGSGANFISYSNLAGMMGRTYVHSKVRDVVLSAYKQLNTLQPRKVFKYAETGFASGGPFKPHKTHQNGLSVDFMVPVVDKSGQSVHLPTNIFNNFGYAIEFDGKGRTAGLTIDYTAMAAHIVELHKQAGKHGIRIWRVIFDPQLQPRLFATSQGGYLKQHLTFSKKRSWVRHDEHYHVDFIVDCKPYD